VFEPFVKRRDARFADPIFHQLADGIVDHGGGDARRPPKTIGKPGGDIVFTPRDMHFQRAGPAKGHDPRIQPMHERAQGEEVELAGVLSDLECGHEKSRS